MRTAVVLMTGFALLVAGVLVLALTGATLLGAGLVAVGLLVKIGGILLDDGPARAGGPAGMRASTGRPRRASERSRAGGAPAPGVTVRARRPTLPAEEPDHGQRRAS